MVLLSALAVLAVILKTFALITTDENASKICKSYGKFCPVGKVCVIQHLTVPRVMQIPVCVPTRYAPAKSDFCKLPPDPGKCSVKFHRWYYNRHSKQCSWFYYGGCHGNENRFRTKKECEKQCLPHNQITSVETTSPVLMAFERNTDVISPPTTATLQNSTRLLKKIRKRKRKKKRKHRKMRRGKKLRRRRGRKRKKRKGKGNKRKLQQMRRKHAQYQPLGDEALQYDRSLKKSLNHSKIRMSPGGAAVHRLFSILHRKVNSQQKT